MDLNKLLHDPCHLGVPSNASKMISEPMVRLAQTVHYLALRLTLSPNRLKRASTRPLSPRSTIGCAQSDFRSYGTFGANRAPILHWDNTISKQTETRFHLTHVTLEYHHVRLKWFPSLWYVKRIPCTYLLPWLALSPNRPKQASTWPTSPRSTFGCVKNDSLAYGTFDVNHASNLHEDSHYLQMDRNELPLEPHHVAIPWGASKMISRLMVCSSQIVLLSCVEINTISKWTKMSFHLTNITMEYTRMSPKWFRCPWYIRRKLCTYIAPRLTLSPNGPKQAST